MINSSKFVRIISLVLVSIFTAPQAFSHLMQAQHGTLNMLGNDVYMVVSLPTSAFKGLDKNNDGTVSMVEFNLHRPNITADIKQHVRLTDEQGPAKLIGLTLSPVLSHNTHRHTFAATNRNDHHHKKAPLEQSVSEITVLGKFILSRPDTPLKFHIGLFGEKESERSLAITSTRKEVEQRISFELSPEKPFSEIPAGKIPVNLMSTELTKNSP